MNIVELEKQLVENKISPMAYSLNGGLPNEQYVLSPSGAEWFVYYSERGQRSGERKFTTEEEACRYFLNLLVNDPLTRM